MTDREWDVSEVIEDAEHACFLCPMCDQPMEDTDDVEIAVAFDMKCLVHKTCLDDFIETVGDDDDE